MDLLGKHKINAFLQKLNIFDSSGFVKACHILITFTGQTFNIWQSNNCCSVKFINFLQVGLNMLLLNLQSTLALNCLLDETWFWFSEERELIKQSWLICLDDIRVYSFSISGFLDSLNIQCVDSLHWLYNIFTDLKFMPSFESGNNNCSTFAQTGSWHHFLTNLETILSMFLSTHVSVRSYIENLYRSLSKT